MKKIFVTILSISSILANAQNVGIGTPNPQNKLHVAGGFRLDTLTGVNGAGLLKHDANGVVYGIKFSGNANDVLRGDGSFGAFNINGSIGWLLNGNSGTNPASNFMGTIDNQPIVFKVNNIRHGYLGSSIFFGSEAGLINTSSTNIGIGTGALRNNTMSSDNTAIGHRSLYANSGGSNTALGTYTLEKNTFGGTNIAIGNYALNGNTEGNYNVGVGYLSLFSNKFGSSNTAVGNYTLTSIVNSPNNTAIGYGALQTSTVGEQNTAIGAFSLNRNFIGSRNTAVGCQALYSSQGGGGSALGYRALYSTLNGQDNSALGTYALENNRNGWYNCAFGAEALRNNNGDFADGNTAIGSFALKSNTTGARNTAIGYFTGFNLPNDVTNVTAIGSFTGWNTTLSNHVNIGNFSVTWIGGQVGWFHYSDKRIKNDIKDDVPGLSFITRLKPVTYHVDIDKQEEIANAGKNETNSELIKPVHKNWEGKYDVEKIKMTGFFAQDVEEAAKAINYSFSGVHNPKNGGLYSLDYSAFVVPLVKAVQEQQTIIDRQQKLIDELLKRVEALEKK